MKDSSFDILCVGNSVIDAFLSISESNPFCRFDKEKNELAIRAGEKIIAQDFFLSPGGGACNVSIGLSRLGFKTIIVSEIGKDELAQKIINVLKKENVDTSHLMAVDKNTSFSVILQFVNERTILTKQTKGMHDFRFENINANFVYLSGLGQEWENVYKRVLAFTDNKRSLAFNPGQFQIKEGRETLLSVLSQTEILFVNKEEAQEVLISQDDDVKILLVKLKALGPKIVIITDGRNGSYAIDKNNKDYKMDAVECEIVGKTGAGDAYASGFLAAFMLKKDINEAMRWASINAAAVVGKMGAQNGLLRKEEIIKK
ncbi:MAG: carbohydrate kinase family protein [Candidatus Levyibacteriota bacterium]